MHHFRLFYNWFAIQYPNIGILHYIFWKYNFLFWFQFNMIFQFNGSVLLVHSYQLSPYTISQGHNTQENPIAVAGSAEKECNVCSNSNAVLTWKSVAKELHTPPSYVAGHFYHSKCSANTATLTHHCITITHYPTAPQLHRWMQSHVIIQYHNFDIECHTTASYLCYPTTLFPGIQPSKNQPLQLIHLNWQTLHEITLYLFKSVKKYNTGQKYCNYQITNPCW